MASITCEILKNRYGCRTIQRSCRLTCGKCTKCPTPPAPCTNGKKLLKIIQIKRADFYFDKFGQGSGFKFFPTLPPFKT